MMAARRALLAACERVGTNVQLGLRQQSTKAATRDRPEVDILRACMMFAGGIGVYTASQELVSPRAGSFFNVNLRGDIDKQMDAAVAAAVKEGRLEHAQGDPTGAAAPKHTWWWRLAHARKEGQPATAPARLVEHDRVKLPATSSMV